MNTEILVLLLTIYYYLLLLLFIITYYFLLLFLGDSMNEVCECFSNSKSSASGYYLAFA